VRPPASIIVPTRERPAYLEVALASLAPQAAAAGAELLVVDDGGDPAVAALAARHGARYAGHETPRGLNAARNTGVDATSGALVVFVDDDVEAPAGWLDALLAGAAGDDAGVLGGPIRLRLEGRPLPRCGRENPPVTALDLGTDDHDTAFVWGANMAIRRTELERFGRFDPDLGLYGDEEDWQRRYCAAGGRVRYLAAAGLDHRRAAPDATLGALSRAAWRRGFASRRFDVHKGTAPSLPAELRTLAGSAWHTVRRRCANGPVLVAHTAGRIAETLRPGPGPAPDFLSGHAGEVGGRRARLAAARDRAVDAATIARGARLLRAAAQAPARRRVLVIGVERPGREGHMRRARAELERSRHDVSFAIADGTGGRNRFANLNALLERRPPDGFDWLLVIDDDVVLPIGFLDAMVFLAERFGLALAQPAHRRMSNAAWPVTRRRAASAVRETAFVEIGPVTLFRAETFDTLLPFPEDAGMGWGVDVHWAAVARRHGWRLGVVDAVAIWHAGTVAAGYDRETAVAAARAFLADRPYLRREEAARTLATHRSWR